MSKQYARRQAKNDPKGDRRSRSFPPAPLPLTRQTAELEQPPENPVSAELAIAGLLDRADGWLRITAPIDMKQVYLKWKFSSGKWRGHYVMVVCHVDQLQWGLSLLLYKCYKVDENHFRPSVDAPYDYT